MHGLPWFCLFNSFCLRKMWASWAAFGVSIVIRKKDLRVAVMCRTLHEATEFGEDEEDDISSKLMAFQCC